MNKSRFWQRNIQIHLMIWGLIVAYVLLVDPIYSNLGGQIFGSLMFFLGYVISFYSLSLLIIPKFWRRNYYLFFTALLLLFFSFFVNDFLTIRIIIPYFDPEYYLRDLETRIIFTNSLLLFFLVSVASFSFHFNRISIEKIKQQKEREKSLILKELHFLKIQFNSHITFNFLNFCYSHVHKSSPKASEAIEIFSDMLRYSLRLPVEEKTDMYGEILYIKNFIKLQKLLTSEVFVNFNYKLQMEPMKILPRILITFVENAFKHGQINNPKYPIEIVLNASPNLVFFSIKNRKCKKSQIASSKIGQRNVKDILNLYYQRNHNLHIVDNPKDFFCELKIF